MSSVFTTRQQYSGGTKIGSLTKTRSLRSTATGGTGSGCSSSHTRRLPFGEFCPSAIRRHALMLWAVYRQGSVSVFQITLHKNLNAFHRIEGVPSHTSLHGMKRTEFSYVHSSRPRRDPNLLTTLSDPSFRFLKACSTTVFHPTNITLFCRRHQSLHYSLLIGGSQMPSEIIAVLLG